MHGFLIKGSLKVEEEWKKMGRMQLTEKLKVLRSPLRSWNKKEFG